MAGAGGVDLLRLLAAGCGRFCCKSRKMKGDENRHETRRDEKVLIKAIVARLRRPLVE